MFTQDTIDILHALETNHVWTYLLRFDPTGEFLSRLEYRFFCSFRNPWRYENIWLNICYSKIYAPCILTNKNSWKNVGPPFAGIVFVNPCN